MTYADYEFYKNEYLGVSIQTEEDFIRLSLRASRYLDFITTGKAKKFPDLKELKMACCALSERYQEIEAAQSLADKSLAIGVENGDDLQSETVGPWTKSYRTSGEIAQNAVQAADAARSALHEISLQYLSNTGLLYRGGRCV